MRMEQEKMENEEKWMKKEKIFENDEESSTLQMQTDRGQEIQVEHSVIQGDKERKKNWGPFERVHSW